MIKLLWSEFYCVQMFFYAIGIVTGYLIWGAGL